jgi:ATP-dependent Lon protease
MFTDTKTVTANVVIFATSNGTERLSKPLLSRFTIFEIPEYNYEEFEGIALRLIKKLHPNAVIQIALPSYVIRQMERKT